MIERAFFFFFSLLFRAAPSAYGSSWARGSELQLLAFSKPYLQPTPQLTAMPAPLTQGGQGSKQTWILVGFLTH